MDSESERILDAYIHDYLVKRRYNVTSRIFQAEAAVTSTSNVIDAPQGFLFEWWSVFWDIFIARHKLRAPETLSNDENQGVREQEIQQQRHQHSVESLNNMQIHEHLLQRKFQQEEQQRGEAIKQLHETHDLRLRQSQMLNVDSNQAIAMRSPSGQSRLARHATSGSISSLHPMINEGIASMPLKGWPINARDHFQHRLLQQPNSLMHYPQALNQYQLEQNYILQAQQNSLFPDVNDLEGRQLGMLLNEQVAGSTSGGKISSAENVVSKEGSALQDGYPLLCSGDRDMLTKILQSQHVQHGENRHGALKKKSQNSDYNLHRKDKIGVCGSSMLEGSISDTVRGNQQASKKQTGQKRKQSSSGPAKTSAVTNTSRPFLRPVQSTSSSRRMEDSEGLSRPLRMLGNNGGGTHAPDKPSAPTDCYIGDQSLNEYDDTFVIHRDSDHHVDAGSTFSEVGSINVGQVDCCHLSSDGKLLVTCGNDKKANVWSTDLGEHSCILEEHSDDITDTRFSPKRTWLATSSLDKTVKVWDVAKPSHSLQTFVGHSVPVTSLDFHPNKQDLICSCDNINEIRYWSIKHGGCDRVLKGGATHVRFQPNLGRYIAAVGSDISIIDVETAQTSASQFKGHALNIQSVCWDFSGELLASASEDVVRVWKIGSGAQPDCVHELSVSAKKFRCCAFHPKFPSLLVIGCSQSLDLWNMAENRMMTPLGEPISALAVSEPTGLVASASLDNGIKMWKWI